MSEMFIPTSVWDQSYDLRYGVFELIEADIILQMMKDIFVHRVGMANSFIMDPFTMRVQLAFRNSYDARTDEYKYRAAIVNDKVRININPLTLCDIMKF